MNFEHIENLWNDEAYTQDEIEKNLQMLDNELIEMKKNMLAFKIKKYNEIMNKEEKILLKKKKNTDEQIKDLIKSTSTQMIDMISEKCIKMFSDSDSDSDSDSEKSINIQINDKTLADLISTQKKEAKMLKLKHSKQHSLLRFEKHTLKEEELFMKECPICYETFDKKILSKCGHFHCTKCYKKLTKCSICRQTDSTMKASQLLGVLSVMHDISRNI